MIVIIGGLTLNFAFLSCVMPDEEKQYWHYHKTEFPRAKAVLPELTDAELAKDTSFR